MKMRKGLVYLRRVAYVIVGLYGLLILLTSTYPGTRTLFYFATAAIPGRVTIDNISGSLTSGLRIHHFVYQDHNGRIQSENIAIKLDLVSLLKFHLLIQDLLIDNVSIYMAPDDGMKPAAKSEGSSSVSLPGWLSRIDLENIKISNVHFFYDKFIFNLKLAQINKVSTQQYRFKIDSNMGKGTQLKGEGILGYKSNFTWNFDIPDIGLFLPNAAGRINTDGTISGTIENPTVKARINAKKFFYSGLYIDHLVADINTMKSHISIYGINYNDIKIAQSKIDIDTRVTKSMMAAQITGHLDQKTQLTGNIKLTDFQKINGKIDLRTPDIGMLPLAIPQIANLRGSLSATFQIAGTFEHPKMSLSATVSNGSAKLTATGAQFTNANASILYQPNHPLDLNARFKAGSGSGSVNGKLSLLNNDYDFKIIARGENLLIADTHEYKVTVSPDLTLDFTRAGMKISGDILIPHAKIYPVEFDNVVNVPDETIFVHNKQTESNFYKNLILDLHIKLGDKVHIRYENLKTRLYGNLHIIKESGSQPTAIGNLYTAHGSYKAYGTELNIQTGRIIYAGNQITDPGLDVRATKTINTSSSMSNGERSLTVGLVVQGTSKKPKLSFFSEPGGLNQKDILSYLLFGYPQSQISSGSALALLSSIAPGGSNASNMTDNILHKFGLTELGMGKSDVIDPTSGAVTGSTSTVNVGKKINDDLSIHYSVGLVIPVSVLNIRYQINRHLMLQAETSTLENGADIVYSLERK